MRKYSLLSLKNHFINSLWQTINTKICIYPNLQNPLIASPFSSSFHNLASLPEPKEVKRPFNQTHNIKKLKSLSEKRIVSRFLRSIGLKRTAFFAVLSFSYSTREWSFIRKQSKNRGTNRVSKQTKRNIFKNLILARKQHMYYQINVPYYLKLCHP